jgi:hypothetical protein
MRRLIPVFLFVGLAGLAFAQGQPGGSWSLGGFGSVLYPGMGHAPTATPPIGQFASSGFGRGGVGGGGRPSHPQHGSAVIVPYPVYYGGYYGGYGYDPSASGYQQGYAPGYADDGSQSGGPGLPSVVINQNFVPPQANPQVRDYSSDQQAQQQQQPQDQSGMKVYQGPPVHPYPESAITQRAAANDQPTIYLIALRDHTIVQALGYWMEGSTLHYVSAEHTLNQLSIDLVDRDLSQRLNDERSVDFRLPQPR